MASNHRAHSALPWQNSRRIQHAVAVVCFFLSGYSGLVYEVSWIRKASLVFGATTFAVSTVLAVFFLGLASGSYLFGRIGQRTSRPLKLYALIEIGLGLFALVSPHAFDLMDTLYGEVYRAIADRTGLLFCVRVFLVALVVFPPTFLMGGTLPLFCRQYVADEASIARSVGTLYAVNTLGAALGCAAAGLVLLPTLGLYRTVQSGAALNLLCGIAVRVLPIAGEALPAGICSPIRASAAGSRMVVSVLFFAVGFVALGSEVLWTRYLGLLIYNTVYTYILPLTVVLVGIVIGSLLASRFFDRSARRASYFGTLQVLVGLAVLTLMMLPSDFWRGIGNDLWIYGVLLLPPAVLSGASFPLAVRMVVEEVSSASMATGRMAAINTIGGILGSLLVGFVGLPFFGLENSLRFITGVSLAVGCAAWIALDRSRTPLFRGVAVILSALAWLGIPFAAGTRIPADFLGDRGTLVAFREGLGSHLAAIRNEDVLQLEIDRWWQGDNRKSHQAMAAHIPMLLHPDPRSVLLVGVGTGQTARRFLMYDVDRLVCVDIEPALFEFVRAHFDSQWMEDERVALIREDGRNYLRHSGATYDVISLEIGQVFRPGVAFFYTADFYHRARERLRPGGVLAQFVPLPFFTPAQFRGVLRSFLDAFPQSILWYNTSELLLIGIHDERFNLDRKTLERLAADDQVHRDLNYSYWGGPEHWINRPQVFLAGYLMGPAGLAELAAGARLYRDDLPVLDYGTSQVFRGQGHELSVLGDLRTHLESVEALGKFDLSAGDVLAIEEIREKNLGEIAVNALIRQVNALKPSGDYQRMEVLLLEALRWNPEHAEANRRLASVLVNQHRYEEARGYYAEAARINSQDFLSQWGLGFALHQLGRIDEAISHYRTALLLQPDHAETHNNLGVALGQRGDFSAALHHFKEAVQLRPGYADAERNLARIQAILRKGSD